MATKSQAVTALKKHCRSAKLIHEIMPYGYGYNVNLEAPQGQHWRGHVHCHSCGLWLPNDGSKAQFWDSVIEHIQNLPDATPCNDKDCDGIRDYDICRYWAGDSDAL